MRAIYITILLIVNICGINNAQCIDDKACNIFTHNLEIAIKYSKFDGTKINEDMDEVIHFLEKITGIESESELGYSGYDPPTQSDIEKWGKWFETNKHILYWDGESKSVRLKTE